MMITRTHLALLGLVALTLAAMALPFLLDGYWLRLATTIAMFAIVTCGLNVIVGFAGYHAFGNTVFFGCGAYALSIAMNAGWSFSASLPLALLAPMLLAGLLGWPLLRLKGHYFAIATVALNLAFAELVTQAGGFTGGANGIALPLSDLAPQIAYRRIYWMMVAVLAVCVAVTWWLSRHWLGTALRALKDNESGAEVMGIDTVSAKILAWMISAAMTGLAGGIWAYWITFIEPSSAFDPLIGVKAYIMMLIGGMGTIAGPLIGALLLELFGALIWAQFLDLHRLLLGCLIVATALALPGGIVPLVRRALRPARPAR